MRPDPGLRRNFLKSAMPASLLSVAAAAGLLQPTASYAWFSGFNAKPGANPYIPVSAVPPASPPATPAPQATRQPARAKTPLERLLDELRQAKPEPNPAVDLMSPDIAVDGASITLELQALLPDVDGLAIYIERNPHPLAAAFYLAPEVLPEIKLMVRLAQSSNVTLVARSQGRFYRNSKFVKVTHGGCSDSFEVTESQHRRNVQKRHRDAP